jgi:hypothetical protein
VELVRRIKGSKNYLFFLLFPEVPQPLQVAELNQKLEIRRASLKLSPEFSFPE